MTVMSRAQWVTMWREGPALGTVSSSAQACCVTLGNRTPSLGLSLPCILGVHPLGAGGAEKTLDKKSEETSYI